MEPRTVSKRRRLVTTCSECHRRKQKCNRQQPCNICIARNVPDRCSYGGSQGLANATSPEKKQNSVMSIQHEEDYQDSGFQGMGFADRIGYSPMVGTNVFVDMRQVLEDEFNDHNGDADPHVLMSQKERASARFWNLIKELPSMTIIEELVNVYFSEVNWYYPIVERYYFDQLYNSWLERVFAVKDGKKRTQMSDLLRDVVYFSAMLYQVIAIGLQFAPPDAQSPKILRVENVLASDRLSRHYSDKGMAIMNILGRYHTTLSGVQHDFLRCLWLKDCGRGSESWHSLGNAIRQGQELNLHLQSKTPQNANAKLEETLANLWLDEYKRRIWVHLFVWDSHMALVLGRPRIINANDCDIKEPTDCSIPENPLTTIPTAYSLTGNEPPSNFTTALFQNQMAYLIHEMRTTGANQRCPKDYGVIQELHQRVDRLLDGLPLILRTTNPDMSLDLQYPNLPRQRLQILCSANSFLSALHRPHIHIYPQSRRASILAAITIIEAQQRFFEMTPPHQYKFFGLAFYTIDAASFLSTICLVYPPPDPAFRNRVDGALQNAIARLKVLEITNAVASAGVKLITHCHERMRVSFELEASVVPSSTPNLTYSSGESTSSADLFMTGDYPRPLNLNTFQQDMYFPTPAFEPELSMDNEFDSSFWIEKMASIPYIPPEDPNFDPIWALPLS